MVGDSRSSVDISSFMDGFLYCSVNMLKSTLDKKGRDGESIRPSVGTYYKTHTHVYWSVLLDKKNRDMVNPSIHPTIPPLSLNCPAFLPLHPAFFTPKTQYNINIFLLLVSRLCIIQACRFYRRFDQNIHICHGCLIIHLLCLLTASLILHFSYYSFSP